MCLSLTHLAVPTGTVVPLHARIACPMLAGGKASKSLEAVAGREQ